MYGCDNEKNKIITASPAITYFDISDADSLLIFSVDSSSISSIYQADINGQNLKKLIPSVKDTSFFNAQYSGNSKLILFIGQSYHENFSSIYIADNNGTNVRKLTDGTEMITESIFSSCADKIYYIKAGQFGKSSPVSQSDWHGADIMSINLHNGIYKNITNSNRYNIRSISEYKCDSLIMCIPAQEHGGLFLFSTSNAKEIKQIAPKSNPLEGLGVESNLQYSDSYDLFAFSAPYDIYLMNAQSKSVKLLVRSNTNPINSFRFLKTKKAIIYTKDKEANFYYVNLDGTGARKFSPYSKNRY